MKHLVIHMEDPSTRFLEAIYRPLPKDSVTLVTRPLPPDTINQMIREHDRVLMLGHGLSNGLFSLAAPLYVISEANVEALREKRDSVFIWCFASDFVKKHGLHGFASGMFISEVAEAALNNIRTTQAAVTASNALFGRLAGECIHQSAGAMLAHLDDNYRNTDCPIVSFNRERFVATEPAHPPAASQPVPAQGSDAAPGWSFLDALNGGKRGLLSRYLRGMKATGQPPRIAWYPSAGIDMRDVLYLSPAFQQRLANQTYVAPPELFVHTDYFPWWDSTFLDSKVIHEDERTRIQVEAIEELPRLDLPLDPEIVDFPEGSTATGRVLFMKLLVESTKLGRFTAPLIYAFAENAAFANFALDHHARFTHCIHVRFGGGGGGGGHSSGGWMLNILNRLGCECMISDEHYFTGQGDERIKKIMPQLVAEPPAQLEDPHFRLPSASWSCNGDIDWRRT